MWGKIALTLFALALPVLALPVPQQPPAPAQVRKRFPTPRPAAPAPPPPSPSLPAIPEQVAPRPPSPPEKLLTPADALLQVKADLQAVPVELRCHTRYLTLYNLPAKDRESAWRVLSGHVNGLSRESDITPLYVVPHTSGALLRLNLKDYRIDPKTWEQLADADPYFHVKVTQEVQAPASYDAYGRTIPGRKEKYTVTAIAPWLADGIGQKLAVDALVRDTQSSAFLLRGDWFFNQTAATVDRKPNYYDFLGVKKEQDFTRLVGFDIKLAERFGQELREAVAESTVTLQPRAIVRYNTLGGAYWATLDFKKAVDKANPLRVFGRDIENAYDASEQYGHLPNGLWSVGLFNSKGELQDTAPDFIASDGRSGSTDRRVHAPVSCVRCHLKSGLQDIDGWVRNLALPPLGVSTPDYDKAREFRQQYLRKLEPFIDRDRARFAEALLEATGMQPEKYAAAYGAFWERYEDARVDLAWLSRDAGVGKDDLKRRLETALRLGQLDLVAGPLLLEGQRNRTLPVRQYEELFATIMTTLKGVP